jgi:hypothetical protein
MNKKFVYQVGNNKKISLNLIIFVYSWIHDLHCIVSSDIKYILWYEDGLN